ncbi:MAG: hypothetical protein GX491_09590 [Chloroflexi bacterium]|nr:hypothetical protein [Chloroflexota bacterium]
MSKWILRVFLAALAGAISASCQARPEAVPVTQPAPSLLTVQASFALQPLENDFHSCAGELTGTALIVQDTPAAALNLDEAAIGLRWGLHEQPDYFAAEIGYEELAVIVHHTNPVEEISLEELQAIYLGEQTQPPFNEWMPWAYPKGDDVQQVFESAVLQNRSPDSSVIHLAPDPAAVLEAVAANPGAVGFLPARWLTAQALPTPIMDEGLAGSVKVLPVKDMEAGQFRRPIVAMSRSEPNGPEKDWLLCLQDRLGE